MLYDDYYRICYDVINVWSGCMMNVTRIVMM